MQEGEKNLSSFQCEHCGANILDGGDGYYTGCDHYPLIGNMINDQRKRKQHKINKAKDRKKNAYRQPKFSDLMSLSEQPFQNLHREKFDQ